MTGAWVLAAPPGAARELRALVRAHEREREVRVVEHLEGDTLAGADGVLVVGDRRRAPSTALPGLVLYDPAGGAVPAGYLPDVRPQLDCFARGAARALRRIAATTASVAVLGQWQERYMRLAQRMELRLCDGGEPPLHLFRWTAERITRDDVVSALRSGLGLGIYFGHGRPEGWAGYHGLRARHLVEAPGEPLGAVLSVTCLTANRRNVALSFCEQLVLGGAAAGAVGAVAEVAHLDSMRWMLGLAGALRDGELRLGTALARALADGAAQPYRLLGDPLAPLAGTEQGAVRAAAVYAPGADAVVA